MLLFKKKKYAAVKVLFKDGTPYEVEIEYPTYHFSYSLIYINLYFSLLAILWTRQVIERKGLDMVRRDWSLLSKEIGDFCLSQILSGR